MPRSLRLQFEGAFYHVISRGVDKSLIFHDQNDYKKFISFLRIFCIEFDAVIHSYCLMSNHIHLLVETKKANISHFMRRLLGDYAMYFNHKYLRVGHLFQSRYKSYLIDNDIYLLEVSRYIHLNPCRAGIVIRPELYRWSSMNDFLTDNSSDFLDKKLILSNFKTKNSYHNFVRGQTPLNVQYYSYNGK